MMMQQQQQTQTQTQTASSSSTPTAPAPAPAPPLQQQQQQQPQHSQRKRRRIDNADLHEIRKLLVDLRPAFIQVLKTPDYQNCKSAMEISAGMVKIVELCKQLKSEKASGKSRRSLDVTPGGTVNADEHKSGNQKHDVSQEAHVVGGSPMGWNFIMFLHPTKASA